MLKSFLETELKLYKKQRLATIGRLPQESVTNYRKALKQVYQDYPALRLLNPRLLNSFLQSYSVCYDLLSQEPLLPLITLGEIIKPEKLVQVSQALAFKKFFLVRHTLFLVDYSVTKIILDDTDAGFFSESLFQKSSGQSLTADELQLALGPRSPALLTTSCLLWQVIFDDPILKLWFNKIFKQIPGYSFLGHFAQAVVGEANSLEESTAEDPWLASTENLLIEFETIVQDYFQA